MVEDHEKWSFCCCPLAFVVSLDHQWLYNCTLKNAVHFFSIPLQRAFGNSQFDKASLSLCSQESLIAKGKAELEKGLHRNTG